MIKVVEIYTVPCNEQKEVTSKAFITIYDWMISSQDQSHCLLARENVLEIYLSAKFFQIQQLEEQCWAFIDSEEIFNEETAFLLYLQAKSKNLDDIKEIMIPRIKEFFITLVSSQDFLLLDIQDICSLLQSNYILVNSEIEIFMSAVRWLKHDWETRIKFVVELMECIRFGLIEPWQLIDIKRNPENPEFLLILNNQQVLKMVDDGLAYAIIKYWYGNNEKINDSKHWLELLGLKEPQNRNFSGKNHQLITYRQFLQFLVKYRECPKQVHLCDQNTDFKKIIPTVDELLASRKIKESNNFICANKQKSIMVLHDAKNYNLNYVQSLNGKLSSNHFIQSKDFFKQIPNENKDGKTYMTKKILEIPAKVQETKSKKFLKEGSLFLPDRETVLIFGGIDPHSQYGIGRNTGKDIYKYTMESNQWEYVTELPQPRTQHSVCFMKGRVYLAGGIDARTIDDKPGVVNTVWSFDPVDKHWYSEKNLLEGRKNFSLINLRNKLYAIGGENQNSKILSSVERFDNETNEWFEISPLNIPRMGAACAKFRDSIWVVGGMTGNKKFPMTDQIEYYEIRIEKWIKLNTTLPFPRSCATLQVINDTMFLIGGARKSCENDKIISVDSVEVWNNEKQEWHLQSELAIARHNHAVAHVGTQLLIIGGVTTIYMRAISNVECYCTERKIWIKGISALPTTLSGHGAITLPPVSLL